MTVLDDMRARADKFFLAGQYNEAVIAYRGILEVVPQDFDAIHKMGQVTIQMGRLDDARRLLEGALGLKSDQPDVWLHYGMALQHLGRSDDAVNAYGRALQLKPGYGEALFCMGVTQKNAGQNHPALDSFNAFLVLRGDVPTAFLHRGDLLRLTGDIAGAQADYESALGLDPKFLDGWIRHGALLAEAGKTGEAIASYDKARVLAPSNGTVWYNRGVALQDLGRDAEALASYEEAVKFLPDFPDAWNNRGVLLRKAGRTEEALANFERAQALDPAHQPSLTNQGACLTELRRFEDALLSYDRVIAARPDDAAGWYNRGVGLHDLGRDPEALESYAKSVALDPRFPDAWNNQGNLLRHAGRLDEAMSSFQRALLLDPRHAGAVGNSGAVLQELGQFAEAGREYRKLELIDPASKFLLSGLTLSAMSLCNWKVLDELMPRLLADISSGAATVPSFVMLGLTDDAVLHGIAATRYLADYAGTAPDTRPPAPADHKKIRIAYVSNDFRNHPTARLIADLFERHDRGQFEVIGFSFAADEAGETQARLKKSFDQLHDIRGLSDAEAAALMRRLEVDIAVDLKGYTHGARPGIFVRRAAPVQVSYLGYPGTTAMAAMDYVIADAVALPMDQQNFYAERIVHLPHSYQCNDPARPIGAKPSRQDAGLPAEGFVFCCFNNHWKITAPVFDSWMRLLQAVPDSVLWLLDDSANASLRLQAADRGVDPARLIFAPKLANEAHLGRLGLADLVLDTSPYNAHTTASDALWVGVPLVTMLGQAFAGRVAASLLTAIGLPELIAADLRAYEALALSLAEDGEKRAAIKTTLRKNRLTTPLFDAPRFCTAIEAAFTTMMETARRGEAPQSFTVPG